MIFAERFLAGIRTRANLHAAPFDAKKGIVTGASVSVADVVRVESGREAAQLALSRGRVVAWAQGGVPGLRSAEGVPEDRWLMCEEVGASETAVLAQSLVWSWTPPGHRGRLSFLQGRLGASAERSSSWWMSGTSS